MRRRHLSVGILLAALLVGAWGQVLAAGLCPHMRQEHACCHARVAQGHAAHEMTGDMRMTHAAQSPPGAEVTASDRPIEGCDHCMGRSSQTPPAATLREVDRTNPGSELEAPAVASRSFDLTLLFTTAIPTREHSPPGAPPGRHVLISVFRI